MRYVMISLAIVDIMFLICNITTGNWGVVPINLLAIMSCVGAAILND